MSKATTDCGITSLRKSIKQIVIECAEKWKVELPKGLPEGDLLRSLIIKTANKYNQKVVILLDEYDKPYTDLPYRYPVPATRIRRDGHCGVVHEFRKG